MRALSWSIALIVRARSLRIRIDDDGRVTQLVRLGALSASIWRELIAGEHEPFGGIGERLSWREKPLYLGIRDEHGRLLAAGGLVHADVRAGTEPLEVAGLGGVIVTPSARGRGLGRSLIAALLEASDELGVERAMLFCRPRLTSFYGSFGFRQIDAPVRAEQPGGRIEMPLCAMWKALRGELTWPPGPVEVAGEPF
jgi:predicted N-acetyltransferase YhbS